MLRIGINCVKNFHTITIRHLSTSNTMQRYEEKQIQLNCNNTAYNINYVRNGQGADKALLLMPGALGSAQFDFPAQIENLPKLLPNYTIIGWDPPGYGKSRPPIRTFPLDVFHRDADVANQLMKTLNFNKYSILGWSDGGITGLIMAAKFKDSIEKLVIWGSNAYITFEETYMFERT